MRGGTEQYYRRASPGLKYDDAATTEVAFRALAAEIAAAAPDPFLVLRTLRLTPEHARQLTATLRDLAQQAEDAADQPRYGLLLGLYQPARHLTRAARHDRTWATRRGSAPATRPARRQHPGERMPEADAG